MGSCCLQPRLALMSVIFFTSHVRLCNGIFLLFLFVSQITNNGEYLSCASLMISQKPYA